MNYTITKTEIARLAAARALQCAQFETEHFRQFGESPGQCPENNTQFARVQWVNGKVADLAFPLGKLANWAKLLENDFTDFTFRNGKRTGDREIAVELLENGRVQFTAGGSQVCFNAFQENVPSGMLSKNCSVPISRIGAPLRVVAPEQGGEFKVETPPDSAPVLKSLKKQVAESKKAARQMKELGTAIKRQRAALDRLKVAAKEYCAALETCGAVVTPAGIVFALPVLDAAKAHARQCLKARRMLRAALASPENCPAWWPDTYTESKERQVLQLGADGKPVVGKFWKEEFEKVLAKVGESARDPASPEFNSVYFDYLIEPYEETIDARAEFAGRIAELNEARKAEAEYKPRKLVSTARVYRWRRHGKKPLLKQEKLAQSVESTKKALADFIRRIFRKECEKNKLDTDLATEWFTVAGAADYSRARLIVRAWPEIKAELAADYRQALEAKRELGKAGIEKGLTVIARSMTADGMHGKRIRVGIDTLRSQINKCQAKGMMVEILESCNPAWPVGPAKLPAIEPEAQRQAETPASAPECPPAVAIETPPAETPAPEAGAPEQGAEGCPGCGRTDPGHNPFNCEIPSQQAGPDIEFSFNGGAMIEPLTQAGRDWITANVSFEPWQLQGEAIAAENNYARNIREAARAAGLEVG